MRGARHLAPRFFSLSRSSLHAARPISCILGNCGFSHIILLNAEIMKALFFQLRQALPSINAVSLFQSLMKRSVASI
jgi:hypothetical protein